MASVEIARVARDELVELIDTRSLPVDTQERVWHSLLTLEQFPNSGKPLTGNWRNFRALIGPWGWLIAVYTYIERENRVVVVALQDARAGNSAISSG